MRFSVFLVAALAVLAAARSADAESTLVVLARPAPGEGPAGEILNRVRGELLADGFTVSLSEPVPEPDRVAALTRAGRAADAAIVAGLYVDDGANAIDLRIVDDVSGNVFVRRLTVDQGGPDQAPEVFARRAVELLRASLLDFLVANLRSAVSEARVLPKSAPAETSRDSSPEPRWAIEAGLGVLGSFDGIGPAIVPLARVHFALNPTFQIRATGAWVGTQPRLEGPTGTATVDQGIALLEGTVEPWPRHRIRPLLSIGAGTYYVGVNGSGAGPYQGVRNTEISFALDGGLGIASLLGPHLEVVIEAHALLAEPGIAVRFVDFDAARIGRPSILGTLTLAGWI